MCILYYSLLSFLIIYFILFLIVFTIVKILDNLLFKFIHQPGAICYLYMPCRHLNIMMLSDT